MYAAEPKVAPLPSCAACGQPAPNGFWDLALCDDCFGAWSTEAPLMEPLELEYGNAHPEDVEERGVHAFHSSGAPVEWVILKRGAAAHVARAAATAWLVRRRQHLQRKGAA